ERPRSLPYSAPPMRATCTLVLVLCGCAAGQAAKPGAAMPISETRPGLREADEKFLRDLAETRGFTLGRVEQKNVQLTPGGETVVFLRAEPRRARGHLYVLYNSTGEARELFTPEQALGAAE